MERKKKKREITENNQRGEREEMEEDCYFGEEGS
jgi:hypothetical protein